MTAIPASTILPSWSRRCLLYTSTQIQFGVYRFGERLPTIEEAARLFLVSVKTIRAAYGRLQRDGYLTISKNVGVKVRVAYSEQEIEAHIQRFFAERKDALLDRCV